MGTTVVHFADNVCNAMAAPIAKITLEVERHAAGDKLRRPESGDAQHGQTTILQLCKASLGAALFLLLCRGWEFQAEPGLDEGDFADPTPIDQCLLPAQLKESGKQEDLELRRLQIRLSVQTNVCKSIQRRV